MRFARPGSYTYYCNIHPGIGNGFWNSGVLDSSPTTPLPASQAVTFAAVGSYQFYCLLHPFMHRTVVVQRGPRPRSGMLVAGTAPIPR